MIKDAVSNYMNRVWNEKDLTAIDHYVHERAIIHSLLGAFYGVQAMKNVVQVWLNAIPDMQIELTALIAEDNKAAVQWNAKGTHKGYLKGIHPTDKPLSYSGVTIYGFEDNKIIDYWAYVDMDYLLKQIR